MSCWWPVTTMSASSMLLSGSGKNGITVRVQESHAAETTVAKAQATLEAAESREATLADPAEAQNFRAGDTVRLEQAANNDTVVIEQIATDGTVTFATPLANAYDGGTMRIADIRADVSDAAALAVRDANGELRVMPATFRADRAAGWNRPIRSRSSRSKRAKSSTSKSTKKPTAKPAVKSAAKATE